MNFSRSPEVDNVNMPDCWSQLNVGLRSSALLFKEANTTAIGCAERTLILKVDLTMMSSMVVMICC